MKTFLYTLLQLIELYVIFLIILRYQYVPLKYAETIILSYNELPAQVQEIYRPENVDNCGEEYNGQSTWKGCICATNPSTDVSYTMNNFVGFEDLISIMLVGYNYFICIDGVTYLLPANKGEPLVVDSCYIYYPDIYRFSISEYDERVYLRSRLY